VCVWTAFLLFSLTSHSLIFINCFHFFSVLAVYMNLDIVVIQQRPLYYVLWVNSQRQLQPLELL
jgi:hypothetical protein